jgi:hypothetical protein
VVSDAVRLERERRKSSREAVMAAWLTDPLTLAIVQSAAGMYAAERIKWSEDEGRNTRIRIAMEAGIMYAALTRVGAKGWPAAVASLGGGILTGGSGAGTAYSPLQAGEAALVGAGIGSVVPGVGTLIGGGVGFGIDTIYQWIT